MEGQIAKREYTMGEVADYLDDLISRIEHDEMPVPSDQLQEAASIAATDNLTWMMFYDEMGGSQTFALAECVHWLRQYQTLLRKMEAAKTSMSPMLGSKI